MLEHIIHFLEQLHKTVLDLHGAGILVFAGVFVVAQLFMVPVSPLGLAAGFFFGFGRGWLALMLGCALGASVNFLISRHFARGVVTRQLGNNEKFRIIDSAIGREGWKIVALLRFVPIPFGIANYCYGLTPVRFWPYLAASCVAIIPANSLFVWMGATFQGSLASLVGKGRPIHPLEYALVGIGFLAAVIALRHVAKIARAAVVIEPESP
jgi:uncharacterized membrane protein YdjX (TVP38/TMEM64 family)